MLLLQREGTARWRATQQSMAAQHPAFPLSSAHQAATHLLLLHAGRQRRHVRHTPLHIYATVNFRSLRLSRRQGSSGSLKGSAAIGGGGGASCSTCCRLAARGAPLLAGGAAGRCDFCSLSRHLCITLAA
jgi:hypothetical protein